MNFRPDAKLESMRKFLLIILVVSLILAILSAIFLSFSFFLQQLIQTLFLFMGYYSVLYIYLTIFILFQMMLCFSCFTTVGIVIQQVIITGNSILKTTNDYVAFSLLIIIMLFSILAIATSFSVYKEMKAQFIEASVGIRNNQDPENNQNNRSFEENNENNYVPPQNNLLSNNRNNNNNNSNNNNRNNVNQNAFQGRGVAFG